jgi:hypothetical protein
VKAIPSVPGIVAAPAELAMALQAGSGLNQPAQVDPLQTGRKAAQPASPGSSRATQPAQVALLQTGRKAAQPASPGSSRATQPAQPLLRPVSPCDIRNGRLAAGDSASPAAAALPPPSIAGMAAAAVLSSPVATCDMALEYQRLYEEQRDLSPLNHLNNNHCATSAVAASATLQPAAPAVGSHDGAVIRCPRRPSAGLYVMDGGSLSRSADYRLSGHHETGKPARAASGGRDPNYQYVRKGETYLGPEYSTTLPHKVRN